MWRFCASQFKPVIFYINKYVPHTLDINYTPNDCESYLHLGLYVNKSNLSDELKYKLLTTPYVPSENYDFKMIVLHKKGILKQND